MINQQIVRWLRSKEAKNYPSSQLKHDYLIKQGFSSLEIYDAMNFVNKQRQVIQQTEVELPKNSSKPWLTFALIVILLMVIGGGICLFYLSQNGSLESETISEDEEFVNELEEETPKSEIIHRSVQEEVEFVEEDKGKLGGTINIESDIEVTTDGGINGFEEKFAKCEPADSTYKIMGALIYYYEIIGFESGLCKVKSKFIANPNPLWIDKEMVCLYDNSKDFETAVKDMSNCEGELYDLMMGL